MCIPDWIISMAVSQKAWFPDFPKFCHESVYSLTRKRQCHVFFAVTNSASLGAHGASFFRRCPHVLISFWNISTKTSSRAHQLISYFRHWNNSPSSEDTTESLHLPSSKYQNRWCPPMFPSWKMGNIGIGCYPSPTGPTWRFRCSGHGWLAPPWLCDFTWPTSLVWKFSYSTRQSKLSGKMLRMLNKNAFQRPPKCLVSSAWNMLIHSLWGTTPLPEKRTFSRGKLGRGTCKVRRMKRSSMDNPTNGGFS